MFGLSHVDADQNYASIDFGWHINGSDLFVFESGTSRGLVGALGGSDRLRVSVENGVVKYYQNNVLRYTSTVSPQYPLLADTALYQTGSTISNVVIGNGSGNNLSAQVRWLVSDQLGTPRMIFDQTGSLATVSRHDYLPFGEELYAGTGGRTTAQGYGGDNVRQKFTGYEHDPETGLEFAEARYYASAHGRFTSSDPMLGSARSFNPQSWNRYAYVLNNPLALVDPDGLQDQPTLAERAASIRNSMEPLTTTSDSSATVQLKLIPPSPETINRNAGPMTGLLLQNANQALQDASAMVAETPGRVNPCREDLRSNFNVDDPSAALAATVTTGGAAMLDEDGRVVDGPQNVFNGNTTTEVAPEGGRNVRVSDFLRQNPSVPALNVGKRTFLDDSFNGLTRLERAQAMIHERIVHAAGGINDTARAPSGSQNPRIDGSRRINAIIKANCNRLPR